MNIQRLIVGGRFQGVGSATAINATVETVIDQDIVGANLTSAGLHADRQLQTHRRPLAKAGLNIEIAA